MVPTWPSTFDVTLPAERKRHDQDGTIRTQKQPPKSVSKLGVEFVVLYKKKLHPYPPLLTRALKYILEK